MSVYLRLILLLAVLALVPLHAVPVFQCSYNAGAFVTAGCYSTTAFLATNDFLDWGAPGPSGFGSALNSNAGGTHDISASPWTTNTNNGNLAVGITQFGAGTGNSNVSRVDNMTWVLDANNDATTLGSSFLRQAGGYFNAPPNSSTQYNSLASPYYGDHLIGYNANGGSLILTFSRPVDAVGFRISSRSNGQSDTVGGTPVQSLTVQAYNVTNPIVSTQPYLSYELQDSDAFGACSPLQNRVFLPGDTFHQHPKVSACNTAPFIGIDSASANFTSVPLQSLPNSPWISSILISSTDPNGFYIDGLFINDASFVSGNTPEPGTPFLVAGGLALAGLLAKVRRGPRPAPKP